MQPAAAFSYPDILSGYGEINGCKVCDDRIIFNYLRLWQRRGVGLVRETYERPATNPKTGQLTSATRRRIRRLVELPMKDAYSDFLRQIL